MLCLLFLLLNMMDCLGAPPHNTSRLESDEMYRWAQRVQEGAAEPDGWWLKTCAGWSALMLCGAVFGAGIDEDIARREDLGELFGSAADSVVDYNRKAVDSTCTWNPFNNPSATYTAIFRDGIGCTLVEGITEKELRAQNTGNQAPPTPLDPTVPWPRGEGPAPEIPRGVNMECLRKAVDQQFADERANPRAITVVFKESLILEHYAKSVNKDTRLIGWSSTKSVVNGLIGVLVGEGRLNVFSNAPVTEWSSDNRTQITLDEMLHMTSGTPWGFDPLTTTWCLFDSDGDCAHYCASEFLLESPPGELWEYNSGSTYIMSRMVNEHRGDPSLTNFEWPKRKLFHPIGAHSFYIEYQPNAHFLGGAMGYATARDWSRYGLLFLRNGVWVDGTRVLPDGWVTYSTTGSQADPGYGAHWRLGRHIDPDLFFATGFRNENVYVFPRHNLVIARLAMPDPLYQGWNQDEFLRSMLQCFDEP